MAYSGRHDLRLQYMEADGLAITKQGGRIAQGRWYAVRYLKRAVPYVKHAQRPLNREFR